MLWSKKAENEEKLLTAQEFVNVEAIENKILWTRDKRLFAYIQCRGRDNSLLSEEDNEKVTERLTVVLSEQTEPWQILSVPRTVDTRGMIRELDGMRKETRSDTRLKLLSGEISALEELTEEGAKEPLILLKIWSDAARDADRKLLERAAVLTSKLEDNQISARIMGDEDILHLCMIYAELGVWQPSDAVRSDIPYLKKKKRIFTRDDPQQKAENELLEQITPVGGLSFWANGFQMGSSFCRCYGVTRYPAEIDYGWAVKLVNATDCITCITYYPGKASEIGDALSRSIRTSTRDAAEQNDARRRKRYERKAVDADRLIDDLDAKGKALGHISILVLPWAESKEELERISQEVTSRFAIRKLKLKLLSCIQKDAFMAMSPYYPNQPIVDDVIKRIIPLETVVGGYPYTINTLRDDHGVYFARTPDRGIISLDIRYRGSDRTNSGGVISGDSGVGKSTLVKHMIQSVYMQGIPCFVIDPEREYRDLCKNLSGAWYDAGGGIAKVNILEALDCTPDDEDDPAYRGSISPLALHIQQVQDIFQYKIPSLTDLQVALVKRALIELYRDRGITLEMSEAEIRSLGHLRWPIMEDLYRLMRQKQEADPRYEEVATLLEDMAVGADAMIWNGHTNIAMDNNLIVIDTNQLYNSSEQNKRAQYFNLMRLAFSKVTADRTTPCFVVADESQTMVDPEMPQAAKSILNMALRSRKYEGYFWLVFHSIHEFLHEKVRQYGQPILDTATYKILFGTSGQNLVDTVTTFKLTPAEEKALETRQRGRAIVLIGSRHLKVDFDLPQYKLDLMGSGGGR